jgi:membrane-associated phospholipid phosphatase
MRGVGRPVTGPTGPTGETGPALRLAPPWAVPVAVIAALVEIVLAGLVWHATRLDPVDAWAMRWQERLSSHDSGMAGLVATILTVGAMLVAMVAGATLAWLAGRRDAVVLALVASPATLAAGALLKDLVHRTWNGDPALLFPSGHVAVATAAAMTALLVVRVLRVARSARLATAYVGAGLVLLVAVARLVQTVHSLTDVVGGVTTGLVVTLGAASAITAWSVRAHRRTSSGAPSGAATRPLPASGQSRS